MSQVLLVHTISAVIFTIASLAFIIFGQKKFRSSVLVTGITALSYFVMMQGGVAAQTSFGEPIHFTRWIGYALSCSILMVVISQGVTSTKVRKTIIGLTPLVMLSGAVGAVLSGISLWAVFILGSVWYVYLLKLVYTHSPADTMQPFHKYIWLGWTGFPVVFLLSPVMLGLIGSYAAAVIYLLLDVFTKIIFYIEVNMRRTTE